MLAEGCHSGTVDDHIDRSQSGVVFKGLHISEVATDHLIHAQFGNFSLLDGEFAKRFPQAFRAGLGGGTAHQKSRIFPQWGFQQPSHDRTSEKACPSCNQEFRGGGRKHGTKIVGYHDGFLAGFKSGRHQR